MRGNGESSQAIPVMLLDGIILLFEQTNSRGALAIPLLLQNEGVSVQNQITTLRKSGRLGITKSFSPSAVQDSVSVCKRVFSA